MIGRRARTALWTVLAFAVVDIATAQLLKATWARWEEAGDETPLLVGSVDLHHDLTPNRDVTRAWGSARYHVRTNSLGFRDATIREVPAVSARPRLIVIGDSYTFGSGIEFENTFAGRLAAALAPQGIELLNAGVESHSPSIYFAKARQLLERDRVAFDALAVFIDISDIEDEAKSYTLDERLRLRLVGARPFGERAFDRMAAIKVALRNNSVVMHFADALKDAIAFERLCPTPLDCMIGQERARWTVDEALFEAYGRRGLAGAERAMNALFALARAHEVRLLVAVYPWPDQIIDRDMPSRQVEFWRQWAAEREVPFLDLFSLFVNEQPPRSVIETYFIPYDVHWNAAGHRLVAEATLDWLRALEITAR